MTYGQRNTRPGAENTFLKNNGLSEKITKNFFGVVFKHRMDLDMRGNYYYELKYNIYYAANILVQEIP